MHCECFQLAIKSQFNLALCHVTFDWVEMPKNYCVRIKKKSLKLVLWQRCVFLCIVVVAQTHIDDLEHGTFVLC